VGEELHYYEKMGRFVQGVVSEEESMVIRNISLFDSLGRIWSKR
jgi:hypothetical protein